MVAALDCLWRDQSLEKSVGNLVDNLWETARRTCGSTCVFAEQDPPDVCGVRGDDPVDIPCKRLLVSQLRQHGEKCDVAAKGSFVRDRAGDQWQRSLSNRGHGSREDFRLVELTKPNWPRGHEGASKLLDLFRTLTPPVQFVALDMVEEADRVAVRWQLSATYQGAPLSLASMAIYRFKDGRIAEDWGIPIRGEWLD